MNASQKSDAVAILHRYLTALAKRDIVHLAGCFARGAVLDFPTVKPGRFCGLEEITDAHRLAFENVEDLSVETKDILETEHSAMASGSLSVTCRGKRETHVFGISIECSEPGLDRVSWYLDSRGHRPWSDMSVL